jgi:oligopeptide/dipeptide ABC transporter ATP-binding protein
LHKKISKKDAWDAATEMLQLVRIPAPEKRMMDYPHQLSGGMRQRIVIALALACRPSLVIADEPTTALDVTVQAQILDLMERLQAEIGMSTILITHDLGVIAETCDEVVVMYAGRVVERTSAEELFANPLHAYTRGLLNSIPTLDTPSKSILNTIPGMVARSPSSPTAAASASAWAASIAAPASVPASPKSRPGTGWKPARNVISHDSAAIISFRSPRSFPGPRRRPAAPDRRRPRGGRRFPPDRPRRNPRPRRRIRLREIHPRQSRRPPAQADLRLDPFRKNDISHLNQRSLRPLRRDFQMIFQDPAESLDPRMSVRAIIEEPLIIHGRGSRAERNKQVNELLDRVGLPVSAADRYSFEFSGGQRQRIGIARSLALRPKLIVCDEPVSALDVSVQSQILNLLVELQQDFGISYLFIAHDLSVVKHISDRVAVMYLGKIVELAPAETIYRDPRHAYTKALLSAIPSHDPKARREKILLEGDVPSPIDPPAGSAFGHRIGHPRYEETIGMDLALKEIAPGHHVAADEDDPNAAVLLSASSS